MINISKQGNALIVSSDNPYGWPTIDGVLNLPVNTLTYALEDESDFITFKSVANGDILFSASLQDIRINGATVTRDNFVNQFNAVAYAAVSGGNGGASDGVTHWVGTQAEYDALGTYQSNVIYNIIEG